MDSVKKFVKEFKRALASEAPKQGQLRVFDFDDTLVKTDAVVRVKRSNGSVDSITPSEFAVYDREHGDSFDFSEFEELVNPQAIRWVNDVFSAVYSHHGPDGLVVVSARTTVRPIAQFTESMGYVGVSAVALGDADPGKKAQWLSSRLARGDVSFVEFFDDSHKNIAAVSALRDQHPAVTIVTRHVMA